MPGSTGGTTRITGQIFTPLLVEGGLLCLREV